jgi:hypothetical protein
MECWADSDSFIFHYASATLLHFSNNGVNGIKLLPLRY